MENISGSRRKGRWWTRLLALASAALVALGALALPARPAHAAGKAVLGAEIRGYEAFVNTYDDGFVDSFRQSLFKGTNTAGQVYCIEPRIEVRYGEKDTFTFQAYMKKQRGLTYSDDDVTRLALGVDYILNHMKDPAGIDRRMLVQAFLWLSLPAPDGTRIRHITVGGNASVAARAKKEADAWADRYHDRAKGEAFAYASGGSQAAGAFRVTYQGSAALCKEPDESTKALRRELPAIYSVKGAEYEVRTKDGKKAGTLVTGEDGSTNVLEGLTPGTYQIRETRAPAGYRLDPAVYTAEVKERQTFVLRVRETPAFASPDLLLRKVTADGTEEPVAGAEYTFRYTPARAAGEADPDPTAGERRTWIFRTDERGEIHAAPSYLAGGDELLTDAEGHVLFPLGTYTVEETKAPDGFVRDPGVYTQVISKGEDGTVRAWNAVTSREEKHRTVIRKTDITTGKDLPGAKLTVFDREGRVMDRWVTDGSAHTIEGLPDGTYTLREERAPAGHVTAEDVTFTVSEGAVENRVTMEDDVTRVRVRKTDPDGRLLAGASLAVTDEAGRVVCRFTSGGEPTELSGVLDAGKTYVLTETSAPAGYQKAAPVKFRVPEDGGILDVRMEDQKIRARAPKTGDRGCAGPAAVLAASAAVLAAALYARKRRED